MAIIQPFKAVRAVRDKVHLVATRTLSDYKSNILKAKLESNPFSFIHIIYPDFFVKKKTEPNSKERHLKIREVYEQFLKDKILLKEERSTLYLYRQTSGNYVYYGVIGGASVQEYDNNLIKKHEATLSSREEQFTNYLSEVGFNAEPVLLTYPNQPELDKLYVNIMSNRPEYEFSTTDQIKHELWVLSNEEASKVTSLFQSVEATYIADGHHRSASSSRLNKTLGDKYPKSDYFLAFFIDEIHLQILAFHRVVNTVKLSNEEFIQAVQENFHVEKIKLPRSPEQRHEMIIDIRNEWYSLKCKQEILHDDHPVECLDTFILTKYLLEPILHINDLRTDKNIQFISEKIGLKGIQTMISGKKAELGILLYPISIDEIKKVADNNMIMPPKSTWVEPKLRTGLTIYDIKE